MIVVDSSVWIAYFNGQKSRSVEILDRCLEDQIDILLFPLILTEVLAGFKTDRDFESARVTLEDFPILSLSKATHVAAARLYRKLRGQGVTIRKLVDCLIVQACLETGAELLTLDRDFKQIARHSPLKLAH